MKIWKTVTVYNEYLESKLNELEEQGLRVFQIHVFSEMRITIIACREHVCGAPGDPCP